MQAVERDGAAAAGQAHAVGHLGDGADARIVVLVLRDEEHALLGADVDAQVRVTFMFGKTTTSSSGTSSIVLTGNTLLLGLASCQY